MPKIVKANTVESGTVCHRLRWISARFFGIAAWHDMRAKAIEVPAHVGHAPPEINSHAAGQHAHRRGSLSAAVVRPHPLNKDG